MLIHIRSKKADVDADLHQYAERQINGLSRFSGNSLISASVAFTGKASRNPDRASRVELVLFAAGHSFHSDESGNTPEAAFDAALDKLKQQLKKLKEKREVKGRRASGIAEPLDAETRAATAKSRGPQVLVEDFSVKPMDVREAVLQLNKAFRSFYIFYNNSNQVQCVYKREDGNIGLLVPETEG